MNIIDITPAPGTSARGFKTICMFDAQVSPDIGLYGLEPVVTPDGRRLVYAPMKGGRRVATMSRELGDALAALAEKVGAGHDRHDVRETAKANTRTRKAIGLSSSRDLDDYRWGR